MRQKKGGWLKNRPIKKSKQKDEGSHGKAVVNVSMRE